MDYFRPVFPPVNRPPLFQPRMDHFNLMHSPGPFHPTPPPPFAMTAPGPSAVGIYLQRFPLPPPPPPPPVHVPMLLRPGGAFMHNHNQQYPQRDPRKQRTSRRVRQRMKRQPEKPKGEEESKEDNAESAPLASESGYDTTGDCQTPATPLDSPLVSSGVSKFASATAEQTASNKGCHSQSLSDSANSINLSETSLKKLLKDLHRCNVSITKYQTMLGKNCEEGERNVREMFKSFRDHLDAREQDLIQKVNSTKETAESILERRKRTASTLRQAAENDQATFEDSQILELKRQIKCFVTDRKVDEEIGTNSYFQADPDDLIRHIMGFGKVSKARHAYSVWEENPLEVIDISKEQVLFPRITDDGNDDGSVRSIQVSQAVQSESALIPSQSQPNESASDSNATTITEKPKMTLSPQSLSPTTFDNAELSSESSDLPRTPGSPKSPVASPLSTALQPLSPQASPPSSPASRSSSNKVTVSFNRHTYSYRVSATSSIQFTPKSPTSVKSGRPWYAVSKAAAKRAPSLNKHRDIPATKYVESAKSKKVEKEKIEQSKEKECSRSLSEKKTEETKKEVKSMSQRSGKYSSSELQTIQSRIKDSLRQQGVYLYDPVTGDGPVSNTQGTSGTAGRFSSSSIDTSGERGKSVDQNAVFRKKKTPTQLRRERKKRQKERERRQRELEKKSEAQQKQVSEEKRADETEDTTREGDNKEPAVSACHGGGATNYERQAVLDRCGDPADSLSSSDSEPQPESSSNYSQSYSPFHSSSSSSLEKSINDEARTEECSNNHQEPSNAVGEVAVDKERDSADEQEEEGVFLDALSTVKEQVLPDIVVSDGERSTSVVVSMEEATCEVITNLKAGHSATKTKLTDSTLTKCEKEDRCSSDVGMPQDGDTKLEQELKLKPEE